MPHWLAVQVCFATPLHASSHALECSHALPLTGVHSSPSFDCCCHCPRGSIATTPPEQRSEGGTGAVLSRPAPGQLPSAMG